MTKLRGTTTEAIWTSAAYHLASSVFQPAFVSISFIFGRKPVVAVSAFLAVVGSVVGGIAPNTTILILGETLQGAGGGATTALAELIVSDLIPTEFKGRWLMILNLCWAVGCTGGSVLGAVLVGTGIWVSLLEEQCCTNC
jgi:MFS family permease